MKKTRYFLIAIGISAVISLLAFRLSPVKNSFQYITIITRNNDLDEVSISVDGKEFQMKKFKSESNGAWYMNPILNLVYEYESQGYELQSMSGPALGVGIQTS